MITSSALVLVSTAWPVESNAQAVRQERAGSASAAARPRQAAPPAPDAKDDPLDPEMDNILKLWERQSRSLKMLDVMIYRRDVDPRPALGGEQHFQGTAKFESPNKAYIEFNEVKLDKNKKPIVNPKTRRRETAPYEWIKCTGTEVWQYKFDTKQIFIYPLKKEEQERAIEEGPLPFLFNMKADEARNRYRMTLVPEKKGAKVHVIKVIPRLAIDREDFSEALIELETQYFLPTRIILFAPDRKGTREYFLSHHRANLPIDPTYFKGMVFKEKEWKVVRNPEGDPGLKGKAASGSRSVAPRRR
jgi:TIGR03009 family protein